MKHRNHTVGILPVLVSLLVLRQSVVRLGPHWLGEVPKRLGVVQVQFLVYITNTNHRYQRRFARGYSYCAKLCNHLRVVVGQDPGKDWVLHQVVVGSASQRVQVHQVLEVTDLSSLGNKWETC